MVHVQGNISRRSSRSQRRLRPGMHERRSLGFWSRKEPGVGLELAESVSLARDSSVVLPTDYAKPSPLRRQTFDQSWMKWKAREAEAKALREKQAQEDVEKEDSEMRKMFGGDVNDDELRALGILYDSEPAYVIRYTAKQPRRNLKRRTAVHFALPSPYEHFSLPSIYESTLLSENFEIERYLSTLPVPELSEEKMREKTQKVIQHHEYADIEHSSLSQSLPPLSDSTPANTIDISLALESAESRSKFCTSSQVAILSPISVSIPLSHDDDNNEASWDFIPHTPTWAMETPEAGGSEMGEPETWILLGDDS